MPIVFQISLLSQWIKLVGVGRPFGATVMKPASPLSTVTWSHSVKHFHSKYFDKEIKPIIRIRKQIESEADDFLITQTRLSNQYSELVANPDEMFLFKKIKRASVSGRRVAGGPTQVSGREPLIEIRKNDDAGDDNEAHELIFHYVASDEAKEGLDLLLETQLNQATTEFVGPNKNIHAFDDLVASTMEAVSKQLMEHYSKADEENMQPLNNNDDGVILSAIRNITRMKRSRDVPAKDRAGRLTMGCLESSADLVSGWDNVSS